MSTPNQLPNNSETLNNAQQFTKAANSRFEHRGFNPEERTAIQELKLVLHPDHEPSHLPTSQLAILRQTHDPTAPPHVLRYTPAGEVFSYLVLDDELYEQQQADSSGRPLEPAQPFTDDEQVHDLITTILTGAISISPKALPPNR